MPKIAQKKKKNDLLIKDIKKRFGVTLGHKSDEEMYAHLEKRGVPSLVKLLRLISPKND